jgi:adenine-specific DNA-methyltransferase
MERVGTEAAWRNRLIWGDNLIAMQALQGELAGKVDLVYFDPPFATGADFSMERRLGDGAARVRAVAFRDRWGSELDAWLSMIYPRLSLARELLSERGTLYLHLDWTVGHHARPVLDEIFGAENSLGEIIWSYGSPSGGRAGLRKLVKAHDLILVYARQYGRHRFQPVHLPYSERYVADWFKYEDEGGRYRKRWRRDAQGRSYFEKQYLDQSRGVPASTVWSDIQQVYADPRAYKEGMRSELTGYPTQKPERLLERILTLSSEPGDLVADFFCGSGTSLAVAQRMGRRWIGCDQGALAFQIARKRLIPLAASGEATAPFEIFDLSAAERARRVARLGEAEVVARLVAAAGARPMGGRALHGRRGSSVVALGPLAGAVDAPAVRRAAMEARSRGAKALRLLAWEVAPDLEEEMPALVQSFPKLRIELGEAPRLLDGAPGGEPGTWPRLEVAIEEGQSRCSARLRLGGLFPARSQARGGLAWVDAWCAQWDWRGGPLCADFHAFRTRSKASLAELSPEHRFPRQGAYRVLVQAVDLYGRAYRRLLSWRALR